MLLVVLQQTSPLPVCPGDNVTFTCTATVSYPDIVILTWITPNNGSYDQVRYDGQSVLYKDESVGAFTTKLIANSAGSLVSTATLSGVTVQDDGSQRATCINNDILKTLIIRLSGSCTNYTL